MVICPIARAVHCSGCVLVKFCPAKTILGDFGKIETTENKTESGFEQENEKPVDPGDS